MPNGWLNGRKPLDDLLFGGGHGKMQPIYIFIYNGFGNADF